MRGTKVAFALDIGWHHMVLLVESPGVNKKSSGHIEGTKTTRQQEV